MAFDITILRRQIRKALGIPEEEDPDLTNDEIDGYLNTSLWEILDKFHFREKERTGTFNTVAHVRNYEIPTPVEAVQGFAIRDFEGGQHHALDQIKAHLMEDLYSENVSQEAIPVKYLLENCYVRFWPTPDKIYQITFRKWTLISDLAEDTTDFPIERTWIEIVKLGAIYRAFLDLGDLARAGGYKGHQVSLIDTMVPREQKEIVDYQMAGVEVIGRSYE